MDMISVMLFVPTLHSFERKQANSENLHPLSLEFAGSAYALHKKAKRSEDLSFLSCCPQRQLDRLIC